MPAWVDENGKFRTYRMTWPRMGSEGGREGYAVRGIQNELLFLGLLPEDEVNGLYNRPTKRAIKAFQSDEGLNVDGQVGPTTAKYLFFHRVQETQLDRTYDFEGERTRVPEIPDNLLFGVLKHESHFDPGAYYVNTNGSIDRGIAMINNESHADIPDDVAYAPSFAIPYTGMRMKMAFKAFRKEFTSASETLLWNATILQHNTPVGARKLLQTGEYATEKNRLYVEKIREESSEVPT